MFNFHKLRATISDPAIILIRLMVDGVFLSEGIQKWLYPASRGAGSRSLDVTPR